MPGGVLKYSGGTIALKNRHHALKNRQIISVEDGFVPSMNASLFL